MLTKYCIIVRLLWVFGFFCQLTIGGPCTLNRRMVVYVCVLTHEVTIIKVENTV